jgi:hypothetical protein
LVLMPLDLAPSQWEPVLSQLAERYCTITLGGPSFGAVSLLDGWGQSNYVSVVLARLGAANPRDADAGGGSGIQQALAQAEADGTFFIASGYHCAAGNKPR